MLQYLGSVIRTVLAVALVMLAVALAPGVPTVLATVGKVTLEHNANVNGTMNVSVVFADSDG
jgi:hypothetical protein